MGFFLRDMVEEKSGEFGADEVCASLNRQTVHKLIIRQGWLLFAREILLYLLDVFDHSHSSKFDEGTFQVYQTLGRNLATTSCPTGSLASPKARLASELRSKLDEFNESWQLHSGLGMELLWTAFRPVSAGSLYQLETSTRLKGLADRFDALRWASSTSVEKLCSMQRSLAGIHDAISSASLPELRAFQVWKHLSVAGGTSLLKRVQDIQTAIENFGGPAKVVEANVSPYLESQFEMLSQYKACAEEIESPVSYLELRLLAGRSTAKLMKFGKSSDAWETLSQIQLAMATGHSITELAAVRDLLPISTLHELVGLSEVPLRCLRLLRIEIGSISKLVASSSASINDKPLRNLNRLLLRVRRIIYKLLDTRVSNLDLQKSIRAVDQLLSRTCHNQRNMDEQAQHFYRSLEKAFGQPESDTLMVTNEQYEDIAKTSADYIQFFTGCLLLYVPDRPCDPALKPTVERYRHSTRRSELVSKLQALQEFELVFSGQKSSFRSQLVEKRLAELGPEPEVPTIFRPQISELTKLQAECNNIVTGIILKSPTPVTLQLGSPRDTAQFQEVELLRMNIAQAVSRLSNGFKAYEDITKPLICFLQGLDAGLALSLLTGGQQNPCDQIMRKISEVTPFLGASPQGLSRTVIADLDVYLLQKFDLRLHFLKCAGMARGISKDLGESLMQTILQTFDKFYQEWKEQLERDQGHSAAETSLYRYRGGEEESNDADEQNFHDLFPNYDHVDDHYQASKRSTYDAKDQAQRLAGLQREIFESTKSAAERLLHLLQDASDIIARLWTRDLKGSKCPVLAENLFASLLLSLDQNKERLFGQPELGKLYNFYSDANLAEAQELITIVHMTQARFLDLQEDWPEHATLADVLRTSSELLALRHTEPVAKLLTKAEQLHSYIHEWQIVASKQYSATSLYHQLTDLLVSWRRLELSTWARLLDMEDKKCNDDADSWWFIAYEVIIAAPLSILNTEEDLQVHAEQLFSTLANFLESTSIGQYAHRLGMIDCFRNHLKALAKDVPSIGVILCAISNFLSYYTRFESPIQEQLRKGRQKLDKDMKEILLLASWKDTNINALRDSAKRSHHKLFKTIRKYRTLLAQSAHDLIAQGFSSEDNVTVTSKRGEDQIEMTRADPQALQICIDHLKGWETKSERYTNPSLTARRMLRMSQLPPTAIDSVSYLESFRTDLIDSIKELQKETPSKVTKTNSEAIKHLKARKRKLYAETLKALRHMGFRSNMSIESLSKQSSLSIILANTPAFPTQSHPQLSNAEVHFHQVLRIVPIIKERSRDHSEDLNHNETSRSMGYLENIVFVILKQRAVLATSLADLENLDRIIEMMHDLWAPNSYVLKVQECALENSAKAVKNALVWLPGIIEAGSAILEKHGKLGEIDHSKILDDLGGWKDKIIMTNTAIGQLPELPSNLSSSRHERIEHDAARLLEDFKKFLQNQIDDNPGLAYVLKQVAKWTRAETVSNNFQMSEKHQTNLVDLDQSVSKTINSILVAVQRVRELSSTYTSSDEDATWLTRADFSEASCLKNLHLQDINNQLREAMGQIQYLGAVHDDDLSAAGALFSVALPIFQQFRNITHISFNRYAALHRAFCKLCDQLAHSYLQIIQEGFCSPAEDSAAEASNSEKLEDGTGLGEGEGGEDISKDIQDDEDLSELAQGMEKNREKEIEDQEDAVDMNHDELDGEMEDISEKGEDDGSVSEGEEDDIDEETGDVDGLDPTAVDEKLWDGKAGDADKEKEGTNDKGKIEKDGQMASDETKRDSSQVPEGEEEQADGEISQNGVEEAEEVGKEETEKTDPHLQEGQNLDLPEDMDLGNIDGTDAESVSEDSDIDRMSDVEAEAVEEKEIDDLSEVSQDDESERDAANETDAQDSTNDNLNNIEDADINGTEDTGSPADTEPDIEEPVDESGLLEDRMYKQKVEEENPPSSDAIGLGQGVDENEAENSMTENNAQCNDGAQESSISTNKSRAEVKDGQLGGLDRSEGDQMNNNLDESRGSQAFKKLGNALEKWHRQIRQIEEASEKDENTLSKADVDMASQRFEHLHDEDGEADTQALGAASEDQARALDKKAMDSELHDEAGAFLPNETSEEDANEYGQDMDKDMPIPKEAGQQQEQSRPGTFVASRHDYTNANDQSGTSTVEKGDDMDDLDNNLSTTHLQPASEALPRSAEEARQLWVHYESLTRDLSLSLTEQLRLILAPSLAAKMRGDFRTGKRLNVKRIIPYIASQYKRDKIWMRRSIPSKRNYQIMLAVDDSKSMDESGSAHLAFETLALVSKSLSMLEVGQICVVGFGHDVLVAHDFSQPFSSDAGPRVFQQLGFQQQKTNVKKLIADSICLFREARRKSVSAGTELWQLELIISDGVCEDHETIRRLIRQAQEEQIMMVFVIVDALSKQESIVDLSQAVFEPDATGETKLRIKRYLDGFPFSFYLVVGDVRELPGVLSQALRQWFAQIVESG